MSDNGKALQRIGLVGVLMVSCAAVVAPQRSRGGEFASSRRPAVISANAAGESEPVRPQSDDPGAPHRTLAGLAGAYTTVTRFRAQPDSSPVQSTGEAKITSVAGGRFLLEENSGSEMGQSYTGLRLIGYNNATGQYEASWVYSRSTSILNLTGTSGDGGKTIKLTGTISDPSGGKLVLGVITRIVDNDRFVVEIHAGDPDAKSGPMLETVYTRKR